MIDLGIEPSSFLIVVALIVCCDLFLRKAARSPAIPVDGEFAEGRLASNEQLLIWTDDFHFHRASRPVARGGGSIEAVALQCRGVVCSR
jgi:hypothetical protein